jgi:hypothetical protein
MLERYGTPKHAVELLLNLSCKHSCHTLHRTIIAHDSYDVSGFLLMQVSNSTGEVCRAYENLGSLTTEFEFY